MDRIDITARRNSGESLPPQMKVPNTEGRAEIMDVPSDDRRVRNILLFGMLMAGLALFGAGQYAVFEVLNAIYGSILSFVPLICGAVFLVSGIVVYPRSGKRKSGRYCVSAALTVLASACFSLTILLLKHLNPTPERILQGGVPLLAAVAVSAIPSFFSRKGEKAAGFLLMGLAVPYAVLLYYLAFTENNVTETIVWGLFALPFLFLGGLTLEDKNRAGDFDFRRLARAELITAIIGGVISLLFLHAKERGESFWDLFFDLILEMLG